MSTLALNRWLIGFSISLMATTTPVSHQVAHAYDGQGWNVMHTFKVEESYTFPDGAWFFNSGSGKTLFFRAANKVTVHWETHENKCFTQTRLYSDPIQQQEGGVASFCNVGNRFSFEPTSFSEDDDYRATVTVSGYYRALLQQQYGGSAEQRVLLRLVDVTANAEQPFCELYHHTLRPPETQVIVGPGEFTGKSCDLTLTRRHTYIAYLQLLSGAARAADPAGRANADADWDSHGYYLQLNNMSVEVR